MSSISQHSVFVKKKQNVTNLYCINQVLNKNSSSIVCHYSL